MKLDSKENRSSISKIDEIFINIRSDRQHIHLEKVDMAKYEVDRMCIIGWLELIFLVTGKNYNSFKMQLKK
jgi:hypothetical protein